MALPPAGFKGPTSKGREGGKWMRKERVGRKEGRKEREGEGRSEREGRTPSSFMTTPNNCNYKLLKIALS